MSATIQREIEIAENLCAQSYRDGETIDSNPYDKSANPEAHAAWNQGYRHEKNYYEGKL